MVSASAIREMAAFTEENMTPLRKIIFATAAICALATPSFAQNIQMELSDRQALMIDSHGKVSKMSLNASGHRMMMKYARPVKAGTFFYMSGGTLYMVQDRRMAGGHSLRDMLVNMIQ
jgi:hypothetical protein